MGSEQAVSSLELEVVRKYECFATQASFTSVACCRVEEWRFQTLGDLY